MKTLTLFMCTVGLVASTCLAQIVVEPGPSLWGGGAVNPSGEFAVPIVQYNPANGEIWLHTIGLNGLNDSTRTTIGGDDVGLISMRIRGVCANEVAPEFRGFQDGIVWNTACFSSGHTLFGVGAGANFLRPTEGALLYTLPPDLTEVDFGLVFMAVNFDTGIPGTEIVGQVQFVPEPSGSTIPIVLAFCLTFTRRNKR